VQMSRWVHSHIRVFFLLESCMELSQFSACTGSGFELMLDGRCRSVRQW
jgi:hypothetical protein